MNPPTIKILATDRIKQRFSAELIQYFVDRSLQKLSESPDENGIWISHYRTVYGETTVVYVKELQAAKVSYRDEVPQDLIEGGATHFGYNLTEDEARTQIQAMWQATGGDFHAPLPRPDHRDVAGLSFVTKDKELVSAAELEALANDPLFKDMERWYGELEARPDRFKIAAVAFDWDGETYNYAPVISSLDDISEFGAACGELLQAAYKSFVENIPRAKPTVLFSALWVADDDLEYARAQLCSCVGKAMAILNGTDTNYQLHEAVAIFHAASPNLTEGEKYELSKGFDIQAE
jgi:uncharacterized cupin superfamily protein